MLDPTRLVQRRLAAMAMVLMLVAGCHSNDAGQVNPTTPAVARVPVPSLALERAFPNLTFASPLQMLQAPNDDTRWFVVERGGGGNNGKVIVFPNDAATTQKSEFLSIPVDATGEGGLLSIAFHPDFPTTPLVYVSYTRTGPDPANFPLTSVISRFTSNDGGMTLDPASEEVILTLDQPFTNHDGGHLEFDQSGKLFIGFGDGGSGNDPLGNGQNVNTLFGALLRIDVDGPPAMGKNYAIPSDNPFAAGGGAPELYAWGLRNPWRWSFDRDTGRLWLADVGQDTWEEVDIIDKGGNYGWNTCEGAHLRGSTTVLCNNPALINPIAEYDHSQGCSITGGYVYRGVSIPDLFGDYLYGDVCSGTIWRLHENPGAPAQVDPVISSGLTVVSFAQSPDGEVYVVNLGGTLHKIVAGT